MAISAPMSVGLVKIKSWGIYSGSSVVVRRGKAQLRMLVWANIGDSAVKGSNYSLCTGSQNRLEFLEAKAMRANFFLLQLEARAEKPRVMRDRELRSRERISSIQVGLPGPRNSMQFGRTKWNPQKKGSRVWARVSQLHLLFAFCCPELRYAWKRLHCVGSRARRSRWLQFAIKFVRLVRSLAPTRRLVSGHIARYQSRFLCSSLASLSPENDRISIKVSRNKVRHFDLHFRSGSVIGATTGSKIDINYLKQEYRN